MEVIYATHPIEKIKSDEHVMAIGFFDGIHLGHQELLNHAKRLAQDNDVLFSAMTFSPHPDEVIKGETDRQYLTPLPQKVEKMAELGVDQLFVVTFDKSFASLPPADFIRDYIVGINAKHVVVGFDFTFGYKAQGNTELLYRKSVKQGFGLSVIPKKTFMGDKISSTLLRKLLQAGNVERIPFYLGKHYNVKVNVVQQKGLGMLKVQVIGNYFLPKQGKYHVAIVHDEDEIVGEFHCHSQEEAEVFPSGLLDCYGKELTIVFLGMISSVKTVSS